MQTVDEMINELSRISDSVGKEDASILADVSLRLSGMQSSLRKEVARIEKLQPLANAVLEATAIYNLKEVRWLSDTSEAVKRSRYLFNLMSLLLMKLIEFQKKKISHFQS